MIVLNLRKFLPKIINDGTNIKFACDKFHSHGKPEESILQANCVLPSLV